MENLENLANMYQSQIIESIEIGPNVENLPIETRPATPYKNISLS